MEAAVRSMRFAMAVFVGAACAGVSGCGHRPEPVPEHAEVVPFVYRGPVYCYRTLGQPDCHVEPQRGQTERLIGAYVPREPAR